ncbi:MAG TPA: hypothetical protein VFV73_44285 [Streptosporangiaceae bacterium]|nr:hypothetical protein [Streptosporangiaceae bacterium]
MSQRVGRQLTHGHNKVAHPVRRQASPPGPLGGEPAHRGYLVAVCQHVSTGRRTAQRPVAFLRDQPGGTIGSTAPDPPVPDHQRVSPLHTGDQLTAQPRRVRAQHPDRGTGESQVHQRLMPDHLSQLIPRPFRPRWLLNTPGHPARMLIGEHAERGDQPARITAQLTHIRPAHPRALAIDPGPQQAPVRLRRGNQHRITGFDGTADEPHHLRSQLTGAGIQQRGMPDTR